MKKTPKHRTIKEIITQSNSSSLFSPKINSTNLSGFRWKLVFFFYQQPSPKLHLRVRPGTHSSLKGTKELTHCSKSEGRGSNAMRHSASHPCPQWHFRGKWGSRDIFQWNSKAVHMFKGLLSKSSCQEEERLLCLKFFTLQRYWTVKLCLCGPSNVQSYSRPFTLIPVLKCSSQLEVHFTQLTAQTPASLKSFKLV